MYDRENGQIDPIGRIFHKDNRMAQDEGHTMPFSGKLTVVLKGGSK